MIHIIGNYIIPNTKDVILGGTHQVDDYNLKVSTADSAFIFNGCHKIVPSLKHAPTFNEKVGLRPGRTEVSLKIEQRPKNIIIHNIGHGGCGNNYYKQTYFLFLIFQQLFIGVTLCWGCGDEVLSKIHKILKISRISSKL